MLTVFTWGEFLLSPHVRTPGLFVIVVVQPLVLVFGVYLAGLFEHLAIFVSMIGWFIGGDVNLARAVEYAVQTGRSRIVSFKRLLPLTGLGSAESGVYCRVFSVVAVVPSLMFVASWLSVIFADIRSAGMWRGAAASQPAVLTRTKAGH